MTRISNSACRSDAVASSTAPVDSRSLLSRAAARVARGLLSGFSDDDGARAVGRRAMAEGLEGRRLLTTIFAGETFSFSVTNGENLEDPVPAILRVEGPDTVQVELIGASAGIEGATAADVPGLITSGPRAGTSLFGGISGAEGIAPLNPDNPTATLFTAGGGVQASPPSDQGIYIRGLAANSTGDTYGLNLVDVEISPGVNQRQLQLVKFEVDGTTTGVAAPSQIGDATIISNIIDQIATDAFGLAGGDDENGDGTTDDPADLRDDLIDVVGASFAPGDDDTLYFMVNANVERPSREGGGPEEVEVPLLFSIDTNGSNPQLYQGDFNSNVAELEATAYGFTINQATGEGIAFVTEQRVEGFGDDEEIVATTGLAVWDIDGAGGSDAVNFTEVQPVNFGDETLEEVVAMASRPDQPEYVYMIPSAGDDSVLIRTRIADGVSEGFGLLPDPNDNDDRVLGTEVLSLTWNPTVDSPSTGSEGAFLGFDTDSDVLAVIDPARRYTALNVHTVIVTGADEDTTISFSRVDDEGNLIPFSGSAGTLAQNGETLISAQDGTGELYMGLKYILDTPGGDPVFVTYDAVDPTGVSTPIPDRVLRGDGMLTPGLFVLDSNMGNFLWGGTIGGRVRIEGSIENFYAGHILTGSASSYTGTGASSLGSVMDNFAVFGDARTISSLGTIGTVYEDGSFGMGEMFFNAGTDFAIGGRVGSILSGQSVAASIDVLGDRIDDSFVPGLSFFKSLDGTTYGEFEQRDEADPAVFNGRYLGGDVINPTFYNDTLDTAEIIGSNSDGTLTVAGSLNTTVDIGDAVDVFGVPLMAGQTISVGTGSGALSVGVFDPLGRLIATDYDDTNPGAVAGTEFTFTATTPGLYRVAVTFAGDTTFGGNFNPGNAGVVTTISAANYNLSLAGLGDVSLGGVKAVAQNVNTNGGTISGPVGVQVQEGDLGTLFAPQGLLQGSQQILASQGNIRSLLASEVGDLVEGIVIPIEFRAPRGSVGAVRSTTGDVRVNIGQVGANGLPILETAIGDDVQLVDSAANFIGSLVVGRGIGTIRVGADMAGGGLLATNVDDIGDDGFIDLIDVGGDIGTLAGGGPGIDTGTNGNVRYMRAGGLIYRDRLFGAGQGEPIEYDAGEVVTLTEDSGARVRISPTRERNLNYNPTDPASEPLLNPGTLSVFTYPLRSGGAVITRIETDRSVEVELTNVGQGGSAEIGDVILSGTGRPVIDAADPNRPNSETRLTLADTFFDPNDPLNEIDSYDDVNVTTGGNGVVDIFHIQGNELSNVTNRNGEIVSMTATSVGELRARNIGVPQVRGIGDLVPVSVQLSSSYPFDQQLYGINLTGSAVTLAADDAIGNIQVGQSIQTVIANRDGAFSDYIYDGIAGPIVAGAGDGDGGTGGGGDGEGDDDEVIIGTGQIREVEIGEGIADDGTGQASRGGLYASDRIGVVRGRGLGSDIYGEVVASQIDEIRLDGGSLLGADIEILPSSLYDTAREFANIEVLLDLDVEGDTDDDGINDDLEGDVAALTQPRIGDIQLNGQGGILGSNITGRFLDNIDVNGGFGIINSTILSYGDGTIDNVSTDGLGIRGTEIRGGLDAGTITARGDARLLDLNDYTPTVDFSATGREFDPYTGQSFTTANDLRLALGIPVDARPRERQVTNSGVIENTVINAVRNIDNVSAYVFRSNGDVGSGSLGAGDPASPFFTNRIDAGQTIGTVSARSSYGLAIIGGRINNLLMDEDLMNTQARISGPIGNVRIGDDLAEDSILRADGPDGRVSNVRTGRLNGQIRANVRIDELFVDGDVGGTGSPATVGELANVRSLGDIGTLRITGDINSGGYVRADGSITNLILDGDLEEGAIIQANTIPNLDIQGGIFGDVLITNA